MGPTMKRLMSAAIILALASFARPATAAETVTLISVGSSSANFWPSAVAQEKGLFAAAGLTPDIVYAQSNAAVIQQVAAGSANFSTNSGLVDPIRAIEKGAPLALIRLEVQAPPYALLGKPGLKSIGELKGKMISVGGAKDITRIFVERMLAPNGVKPGEFDMTFAGATSARYSALQAGAVDAAILTPPFSFNAQSAGFTLLGNTVDYVDMPFAGISVNTNWAASNKATVQKVIEVYNKSMAWLYDPANRNEAVQILMKVSKIKQSDVELAYDFLIKGKYLEATGKISKSKLGTLVDALKSLGDIPQDFSVDRLFLPGVTQIAD
ncbi:ABC transporter substrate-binding protein [Rhodoplanes sp. Z2-YC6860]|nr:ABC transporter substrate-binding protein [Rhodoplanes sp. Z2-YC6860]